MAFPKKFRGHTTKFEFASNGMKIAVDWTEVERLFSRFPASMAYELRDAFGRIVGRFRKNLRARHAGTRMENLVRRAIFWNVNPPNIGREKGQTWAAVSAASGKLGLDKINFRVYATSEVPLIHETGGSVTGNLMVPIGEARALIEAGGTKVKRALHHQARHFRGDTWFRKEGDGADARFVPMFILRRSITIRPTLGFYETWQGSMPTFNAYLGQALQRAARNAQRWVKQAA